MRKKTNVLLLKIVVFALLFVLLYLAVTNVMTAPGDVRNYQWIAGFYEEPADSLDVVYIGSSNVYAFWTAPLAWERYGIAVWPYSCNGGPFEAVQYIMKDVVKTQPDALFVVTIHPSDNISVPVIHYLTDYVPMSINRLELINMLSDAAGFSLEERLEFYFPLIRYHSRWNELTQENFDHTLNGVKGASTYASFLNGATDVSGEILVDTRGSLSDLMQGALDDLLDYCDENQVNVLFVTTPQYLKTAKQEQVNTMVDVISGRGYPVLDMLRRMDEIGLDPTVDYYNAGHANIHGALKVTDYLARYLVENYDFADKRGMPGYESWDASYDKYMEIISPHLTDEELIKY